jgi:hypothetical protein
MTSRISFVLHLLLVLLAWVGPLMVSWHIMLIAYALVLLQFAAFEKCLLNAQHGLMEDEDPDATFYSEIFVAVGISHNRKVLKKFVRSWLYPLLALWTVILQLFLGWQAPISNWP